MRACCLSQSSRTPRPFSARSPFGVPVNIAFALVIAGIVVLFELRLRETAVTRVLGALIGCAIGLLLSRAITAGLFWADPADRRIQFLDSFILIMLPYLGLVLGGKHGEWLEPARLVALFRADGSEHRYKILDTSVIIDGRIADVCETGFLDGTLVVPQFVLKELQLVADSSDSMKRNRGRRGLDILQKIQKMSGVQVTISDADFPDVKEVDLKLIELARTMQGKIVTNDFNLNKVAQLRGVAVLNVNELANSLKPVVLPGELMKVFILKEGKEYNQGVAYLDDGTMVVVDNARKMISKTIDIVVTSVLQTTAGKMIFGRYIEQGMSQAADQRARRPAADDGRRWIGQLYDRYGAALYRYAVMVLADPAGAADVVQTVFVSLLRRRKAPDSDERYLRRAVRNECFSALRKRRRDVLASASPILETVEGQSDRPDERLALDQALRELPADQREVIHLKVFEGMTFQEIADLTDESINTIASRYRYAIDKLRVHLT